jgi:signal transduction histidine kinase
MRWRFLLAIVIVSGILLLRRVDALLQRESDRDAAAQAVQAGALIESSVTHRVEFLNTLAALTGAAENSRDQIDRFNVVAAEIRRQMPDIASVYLLDQSGAVRAVSGEDVESRRGEAHRAFPLRAPAMRRAAEARSAAATAPLRLSDGQRGTLLYVPLIDDGRVTGYVAGAFAYGRLFSQALAGKLRGNFPYRVLDENGEEIVASAGYQSAIPPSVTHSIVLPGDHRWQLDVAAARTAPATARLLNWITGALVILLVTFFALREELRARRFAAYSRDLEVLSRGLLDANMRLEDRAQQIAEANRAKSRFLANVSHELRTPLNAIVGYNSLALEGMYGEVPPSLRSSHERIQAAADHLLAVVNDVLDLSKIEVGRMDLDVQEVDIDGVFDGVNTVIEPAADAKGLRLDIIVARDTPRLETDPRHLRQILLNLAANAIKFTERGAVTIVAKPGGRGVLLSVEDTGIGIAPGDLDRIFEEFEQVRPAGRGDSMQRGTGLGLAIARKLARVLGGDVNVTSQVGRGSCFTLDLPVRAPEPRTTPNGGVSVISESDVASPGATDSSLTARANTATVEPPDDARRDSGEHGVIAAADGRGVDASSRED